MLSAAQASGAIPKLLGVGRLFLGTPFIALSLVAGTPLSELACITPEVRVAAVAALRQIHAAGVAHGDLRRANIMVVQQSRHTASGSDSPCPLLGGGAAGFDVLQCEAQSEELSSSSSLGSDRAVSGAGGVRVVIIDLGCARLDATCATLQAEERDLQRLLR